MACLIEKGVLKSTVHFGMNKVPFSEKYVTENSSFNDSLQTALRSPVFLECVRAAVSSPRPPHRVECPQTHEAKSTFWSSIPQKVRSVVLISQVRKVAVLSRPTEVGRLDSSLLSEKKKSKCGADAQLYHVVNIFPRQAVNGVSKSFLLTEATVEFISPIIIIFHPPTHPPNPKRWLCCE